MVQDASAGDHKEAKKGNTQTRDNKGSSGQHLEIQIRVRGSILDAIIHFREANMNDEDGSKTRQGC